MKTQIAKTISAKLSATPLLLVALLLVVVATGATCTMNDTDTEAVVDTLTNETLSDDDSGDDAMMEDDAMDSEDSMMKDDEDHSAMNDEAMEGEAMEEDSMMEEESEAMMEKAGEYREYDANAVAEAAENGTAVLFFHAPWCPTCAALNRDIEASLDDIPAGVTIFKVDYDTYTDLRRDYGVTYQHTLVQVDAEGNQITKWSGGNTLETILNKVQ